MKHHSYGQTRDDRGRFSAPASAPAPSTASLVSLAYPDKQPDQPTKSTNALADLATYGMR